MRIKGTGIKAKSSPETEPDFYSMPPVKSKDASARLNHNLEMEVIVALEEEFNRSENTKQPSRKLQDGCNQKKQPAKKKARKDESFETDSDDSSSPRNTSKYAVVTPDTKGSKKQLCILRPSFDFGTNSFTHTKYRRRLSRRSSLKSIEQLIDLSPPLVSSSSEETQEQQLEPHHGDEIPLFGQHFHYLDSRSFEAMVATVFCPDNIRQIDESHNEITKKTSVASALSDHQITIKQMILNACRNENMNARVTELTCLTDGASNCWSITNSLKHCCKKLVNILDWFHVTKRFTAINNHVDSEFKLKLEKVKWFIWHGKSKDGLDRLSELKGMVKDEKISSELQGLYEYLERNQRYMVNYQERQAANLPFTSTYAEVSVNALINTRQKNDKRMQWSREGAHNVLQIRASKFSKMWSEDWKKAQLNIYKDIA